MCVSIHAVRLCPEAAAQFVCAQQANYNHPYCNHKNIFFFLIISRLSFCESLSLILYLTLSPPSASLPPSLIPPPSSPLPSLACCVHMMNSEQMKDALSTLF